MVLYLLHVQQPMCTTSANIQSRTNTRHMDYVELKFGKAYKPNECITIDEQLFLFRDHSKFSQYIESKPAKYHINVFPSAYPLQSQICPGKPTDCH